MLISSIDYNEYVGRIGIGRIQRGSVRVNQNVSVCNHQNSEKRISNARLVSLLQIEGLQRVPAETAKAGDIVWISGIEGITIGDTICAPDCVEPVEFTKISEPTVEMTFSVNDSPFAGREGKFVTSRQLRERLFKETLKDVSLRVEETENTDSFKVAEEERCIFQSLLKICAARAMSFRFQLRGCFSRRTKTAGSWSLSKDLL